MLWYKYILKKFYNKCIVIKTDKSMFHRIYINFMESDYIFFYLFISAQRI